MKMNSLRNMGEVWLSGLRPLNPKPDKLEFFLPRESISASGLAKWEEGATATLQQWRCSKVE